MRRILQLLFCTISLTASAQYVPNSNQAFQFASAYNPAFAGIDGFRDLKFGYRYQWTGFGKDAPRFVNLAYTFRIKEPLDLNLHALRTGAGSQQRKKDDIPALKKTIHGLGLNVFNENVGAVKRLGGGITYAFHYPINNNTRISAGVSALLDNTKIDVNKLYLGVNADPDSYYSGLVSNGANRTTLNVRVGALVYGPRFYFGFSYLPLVNSALKTSEVNITDSYYRATIQGGAAFAASANIDFKPSIMALLQTDNKLLIDYNVKMFIQQKLWFGVSYRSIESAVGMVGFNLNEMLGAAYSYEVATNGMQKFGDGSHELVLSVRLNNFKRLSPQVW